MQQQAELKAGGLVPDLQYIDSIPKENEPHTATGANADRLTSSKQLSPKREMSIPNPLYTKQS